MYYYNHKALKNSNILVTIEEVDRVNDMVLIDFFDKTEFGSFLNSISRFNREDNPSMMLLKNYRLRNVLENTIYAISTDVFVKWYENNKLINENENSRLIGYSVELDSSDETIFEYSVSLGGLEGIKFDFTYSGSNTGLFELNPKLQITNNLSVNIRNVGQGNWNEILSGDNVRLVYDAGCSMFSTYNFARTLIENKIVVYERDRPGLILSHWDKDHYHALLWMSDEELSHFSYFVCRDYLPNATSVNLFLRLQNTIGAQNIFTIPAETRDERGGLTRLNLINPTNNHLLLFNSQYHKNRNVSGLILALRTQNSSVIMPGDAHYEQLSVDVLPHLAFNSNHYLVVPHHGGRAGSYIYQTHGNVSKNEAIISVGNNHFGHPIDYYLNQLNNNWGRIGQTRIRGHDIRIVL